MFLEKDRQKCSQRYDKYYAGRRFFDSLYRDAIRRHLLPGQKLLDAGCGRYLKFSKELSGTAHGSILCVFQQQENSAEHFSETAILKGAPITA